MHRVSLTVVSVTVGGNFAATTDANSGVINMGTMAVDGTFTLAPNSTGAVTIVNDAGLNLGSFYVGRYFQWYGYDGKYNG